MCAHFSNKVENSDLKVYVLIFSCRNHTDNNTNLIFNLCAYKDLLSWKYFQTLNLTLSLKFYIANKYSIKSILSIVFFDCVYKQFSEILHSIFI